MSASFGIGFGEEIFTYRQRKKIKINFNDDSDSRPTFRIYLAVSLLVLGFAILTARLLFLTVIEGNKYYQVSSQNRIRESKLVAPRGIIYDRNGVALIRNIPSFRYLNGEIYFEEAPASRSAEYMEGIAREYIYTDVFAHVLGYTGEADRQELDLLKKVDTNGKFDNQDIIGKMGIEKAYDEYLRGIDGKMLYEVDALERKVRILGKIDPISGRNLNTSLDSTLQKAASEALKDKKGAVVVSKPFTGEILTLYSAPSFDPNNFVKGVNPETVFLDLGKPMFDRTISGTYPPGSTFKIITATAALETGAITRNTQFEDIGVLKVGDYSFGNWYFSSYGKKEGTLDIVSALKRSNDIFFYKTGEAVGIEKLADWAKKMGVGHALGIDIGGEENGLMPDPAWRESQKGEKWYLGNTYHVAIGQGDVLATPLQVNAWTNIIANGGKLCRPHLTVLGQEKNTCVDLGIKRETIQLIREGMKQACSTGGTGWPLFKFKTQNSKLKTDGIDFLSAIEATPSSADWVEIPVACKTGTAEFGDPKGRTHAWITVFAPVVNPQISITVLVENGGEGSSVAGPIAKKILEAWFTKK